MKFSIINQKDRLEHYLEEFKAYPFSYQNPDKFPKKVRQVFVKTNSKSLDNYDFSFLFDYKIFPESLLDSFCEWKKYNREMQVGDVIVLQAKLPYTPLKLIFGVRIISVTLEKDHRGFSYGTLLGHPETGTNTFSFFNKDDSLYAEVKTQASLGSFISKLLGPIFTRPFVNHCNKTALQIMKDSFLKFNASDKLSS